MTRVAAPLAGVALATIAAWLLYQGTEALGTVLFGPVAHSADFGPEQIWGEPAGQRARPTPPTTVTGREGNPS